MLPPRLRLTFEQLEDRLTPAMWGVPWPDPGHLTMSFVPDGTSVGGTPSVLFQNLDAQAWPSTWEGIAYNAAADEKSWSDMQTFFKKAFQ